MGRFGLDESEDWGDDPGQSHDGKEDTSIQGVYNILQHLRTAKQMSPPKKTRKFQLATHLDWIFKFTPWSHCHTPPPSEAVKKKVHGNKNVMHQINFSELLNLPSTKPSLHFAAYLLSRPAWLRLKQGTNQFAISNQYSKFCSHWVSIHWSTCVASNSASPQSHLGMFDC